MRLVKQYRPDEIVAIWIAPAGAGDTRLAADEAPHTITALFKLGRPSGAGLAVDPAGGHCP
jgi:hypothetical protein